MDANATNGVSPAATGAEPIRVKKYPNRRFYDATHSKHVTLRDLHDLIVAGREIHVTDSATGEDITRAVLTQIILEQDPPKLEFFPTGILHQVIRTQRQMLGDVTASFFQQWIATQHASQQRWLDWMRSTLTAGQPAATPVALDPLSWASSFWGAPPGGRAAEPAPPPDAGNADVGEMQALRDEMARLRRQLESLATESRIHKR